MISKNHRASNSVYREFHVCHHSHQVTIQDIFQFIELNTDECDSLEKDTRLLFKPPEFIKKQIFQHTDF